MLKRTCIAVLLLAAPLPAAEPKLSADLPYAEPKNELHLLDVYAPAEGRNHPIIVWLHGGGRTKGQKAGVDHKAQAFTDRGFLFVPINYRFIPQVTMPQMAADAAKAVRWSYDHAAEYGGDSQAIVLMGHSAGAHLAALISTDERYLKAEGLSLRAIKGCIPVDVGYYDVPKLVRDHGPELPPALKNFFGATDEVQRELSPASHIARDKPIPPFLILFVADRPETHVPSCWFAERLNEAGVPAEALRVRDKTHDTINADLGLPDDPATQAVWKFLDKVLQHDSAGQSH
jgi:acetyl esterase/lipase